MTRCPTCSKDIPEGTTSCPSCGTVVEDLSAPTYLFDDSTPVAPQAARQPSPRTPDSSASFDSIDDAGFVPGTILAERYRIVGLLGKGGMGEVYRADDLKLGQPVALKFLPDRLLSDGAALARFHREVRIARQVSHKNVSRVYDIGEVDGRHFLSMEFIKGEELSSLLRRIGRLPEGKATEIARQLCAGLAAAHDRGVLHRDLKPSNVMIDENGNVRITDFGLAGLEEEIRGEEIRAGTPAYMSPEQLAGKELSVRSDIYALGLVLYEAFTGKRVFDAGSLPELLELRNADTAPTTPSSLVKDIDPVVERIILRCLEKDPGKRPASALQVAAALPGGDPLAAALAAGETPSPEMVAAAQTEDALRPRLAIALLSGALLLLIGLVLMSEAIGLNHKIPFDQSPEVLKARAGEIVKQLGYTDAPADYANGFAVNHGYFDYITKNDSSPGRWDKLASGQPALVTFWYRQSPDYLRPFNLSRGVIFDDPPQTAPGMSYLALDTRGRLIKFSRVPPQANTSQASTPTPDWSVPFNAAGLDINRFTPTAALWNPPQFSDARAAWQGAYPDQPQIPLRIEAAAYHGKPTYFALIGPWEKPAPEQQESKAISERISTALFGLVLLSILLGAVLLARHNLKLGRGDRKGAFRLALFVLILQGAGWLVRGHVPEVGAELDSFAEGLAQALFFACMTWLIYIALEPFLRRRWPNLIISWNRLLAGHYRDPLVGRDILVGGVCGIGIQVLAESASLIPKWLGKPYGISTFNRGPLLGVRSLIASFTTGLGSSLGLGMSLLFLLLLFSILLRKRWLAASGIWLFGTALITAIALSVGVQFVFALVYGAIFSAVIVILVARYGLLATCLALLFNHLGSYPLTINLSVWYAQATIFALTICIGLVFYGFYTSLAGQRVFRAGFLQD